MSMVSHLASSWRPLVAVAAGSAFLFACTLEAPAKKKRTPPDCTVEDCYAGLPTTWEAPLEPDKVNANSGAFGAAERPSGNPGVDPEEPDEGEDPVKTYCGDSVEPGDLAIVEIMISSRSGAGDTAEWVEIQNTRDCWLKLKGVSVQSPRGAAAPNVAIAPDDLELAPHGTFLAAGSSDPAKNNGLPGVVLAWNATDVLKNDGDTVRVALGDTTIDSVDYPRLTNLTPGRAFSFPRDCPLSDRASWERWSLAFDEWSPGLKGTPNRPNTDVTCF